MNLEDLGWTPSWAETFSAHSQPTDIAGRILRVDGSQATAWTAAGECRLSIPSSLRKRDGGLVVGDWVAIEPDPSSGPSSTGRATRRLPRQTHLARKAAGRRVRRQVLAANLDVVFILSSMDADLSERRLERYLTVTHDGGARPVILLTKAGVVDDPEPFVRRARAAAPGVDIHGLDVLAGIGTDTPGRYLGQGITAVLVGSSGVGKSTLLNHLMGTERMTTREVRASDGLGQHTTTHRELFVLAGKGVVIDTPGLRELALWADADALDRTFGDVEALARCCRFGDCSHEHEPGCAVRDAVESGQLDSKRLAAYVDLRREIEVTAVQMPEHERRKRDRQLGRLYRRMQANKRSRR